MAIIIYPSEPNYVAPVEPPKDELTTEDRNTLISQGANWINNNHPSGILLQDFIEFAENWLAGKPAYQNKSISRQDIVDIALEIRELHGTPSEWAEV